MSGNPGCLAPIKGQSSALLGQFESSSVSDIEFLLIGFNCGKQKTRTSVWTINSFLYKVYTRKLDKKELNFDEMWEEMKNDFKVAKKCFSGNLLDEALFV